MSDYELMILLREYVKLRSDRSLQNIANDIGITFRSLKRFLNREPVYRKTVGKIRNFIVIFVESDNIA